MPGKRHLVGAGGGDWVLSSARIQHLKSRFAGERKPQWRWWGGESGPRRLGRQGLLCLPGPGPVVVSTSLPSSQAGSGSVSVSASLFLSLSRSLFLHLSLSFSLLHLSLVSPEAGEPPSWGHGRATRLHRSPVGGPRQVRPCPFLVFVSPCSCPSASGSAVFSLLPCLSISPRWRGGGTGESPKKRGCPHLRAQAATSQPQGQILIPEDTEWPLQQLQVSES